MIVEIDKYSKSVIALLEQNHLPTGDVQSVNWFALLGWMEGDDIVAVGGLERCDQEMLLRSIVVSEGYRKQGIAFKLVNQLHGCAVDNKNQSAYLLTLDAADYFCNKFDYQVIERNQAPAAIASSSLFSQFCPGSATLMKKQFN